MFDGLRAALRTAEQELTELEAGNLIGGQPAQGLALLGKHERVVAAARARLTARAEQMRQWEREGYRSFEDWYAATFGVSYGQAKKKTRAARNYTKSHRTAEALADGEISEDEAETIADAADKNPEAEPDLIDTARNRHRTDKDLKDKAAEAKAAVEDDRARAERLRRGRRAGWGTDREGFWTLNAKLQPEVGAELKARLAAETDRVFRSARRSGTREGHEQYRADAVANLVLGRQAGADAAESATPTAAAGKELVLDINLETLRRGCVDPDETCTIRGVGPVPVEVARDWVHDAFIKAVIRDGTDIKQVVHYGRHVPAHVRTALGIIDQVCSVPGCANPRVELDHDQRHADLGPSSVANLRPLCVHHHRQRTHDGYELVGDPGDRRWIGPDGRVLFADRPHHLNNEPARAP
jgi:hypothetical protein